MTIMSVKFGFFAAKKATTKAIVQSSRVVLLAANPAGIAADLAQAGCEAAGYNSVGKGIGVTEIW